MKITSRQLRQLIREVVEDTLGTLDAAFPVDVEAEEDAWAGGDNLVDPIDHSEAGGSEAVTPHQEILALGKGHDG